MNKTRLWLFIAVLAVVALMTGSAFTYATTYHADKGAAPITLYQANNQAASGTTPYSTKATCARVCHPAETGKPADFQHTYGTGTSSVAKNQKVIAGNGTTYSVDYTVASFAHGVSIGRHMNQGRNEAYSAAQRTAYGDPFFTSSPGMAGKY